MLFGLITVSKINKISLKQKRYCRDFWVIYVEGYFGNKVLKNRYRLE